MDTVIVFYLVVHIVIVVEDKCKCIAQRELVMLVQLVASSYDSPYLIYTHMVAY